MASYTAVCTKCSKVIPYERPIAKRDDVPWCCGQQTERKILVPPSGFVDVKAAG